MSDSGTVDTESGFELGLLPDSDRGGIVTARGTGEGLVLRIDGRVALEGMKEALSEFLATRLAFVSGNPVAIEWVGSKPDDEVVNAITSFLTDEFSIKVRASRLREVVKKVGDTPLTRELDSKAIVEHEGSGRSLGLFGGVEAVAYGDDQVVAASAASIRPDNIAEALLWDDPDARVVYATLRSGQKIESEHSLVIFGDVNSGAEVVAGGDIIVLGTLRGVAHAGAFDETGGGRSIFALNLRPTQLRIGSVISRGTSDGEHAPEIARVEANLIVVEPYQARSAASRGAPLSRRTRR